MAEEKLNIAIIGSGCAGLGALYGLRNSGHNIDLYEKDNRIGGHAHTVQVPLDKEGNAISASRTSNGEKPVKSLNVDSGFIVFNDINYRLCPASSSMKNQLTPRKQTSKHFSKSRMSSQQRQTCHSLSDVPPVTNGQATVSTQYSPLPAPSPPVVPGVWSLISLDLMLRH